MPDQSIGTISALIKLNLTRLGVDVQSAKALIGELGTSMQSQMGGLAQQAGTAMAAMGAAIIGGLGVAANSAAQFDQALRNVDSIAKLTGDQFSALHDSVLAFANDPNIRQGPTDLAKGLYDIQSSGASGQEALEDLKQSAYGASAGMTDTATASKVLMAVLNSGVSGVHSAKEAMDVLFREVDLGVNTFGELANSLGNVLPTARNAKVSLQEVAAAMAVMTRGGISADESVTALNNLMIMIINPHDKAAKRMKELGIEYGSAALQAKGLVGWIQQLNDKIHGNADEIFKILPEHRAQKAALSLLRDEVKPLTEMFAGMKTASDGAGSSMNALERQNKGAVAQMQLLGVQIEKLGILIGETLAPFIAQGASALTALVKWISSIPTPVKEAVVVFTALGGVILTVSGLAIIAAGSFAALSAACVAAGTTLAAVAAAAWPITAVVVGIGAALALLVTAWTHDWGHIREVLKSATDAITAIVQPFLDAMKGDWAKAYYDLGRLTRLAMDDVQGIWDAAMLKVGEIIGRAAQWIEAQWARFGGQIETVTSWIVERLQRIVDAGMKLVRGDWQGAWNGLVGVVRETWPAIVNAVQGIVNGIISTIRGGIGAMYSAGTDMMISFINGMVGAHVPAANSSDVAASMIGQATAGVSKMMPKAGPSGGPSPHAPGGGGGGHAGSKKDLNDMQRAAEELKRQAEATAQAVKDTKDSIFNLTHDDATNRRMDALNKFMDRREAHVPFDLALRELTLTNQKIDAELKAARDKQTAERMKQMQEALAGFNDFSSNLMNKAYAEFAKQQAKFKQGMEEIGKFTARLGSAQGGFGGLYGKAITRDAEEQAKVRYEIDQRDYKAFLDVLTKKIAGLKIYSEEWKKVYQQIQDITKKIVEQNAEQVEKQTSQMTTWLQSLKAKATDFLGNSLMDGFQHGFKGFFDSLLKQWEQLLEEMLAKAIASGIISLLTGGSFGGGFLGGIGSVLGFDDWGNDRKAVHWGYDFAGLFGRGMEQYQHSMAVGSQGSRAAQTTIHAPITVHATINNDMDIATLADKLAWHTQTRMRSYVR